MSKTRRQRIHRWKRKAMERAQARGIPFEEPKVQHTARAEDLDVLDYKPIKEEVTLTTVFKKKSWVEKIKDWWDGVR